MYKGGSQVLNKIDVKKVVCKIDNIYFDSYAAAGRYLQVSRQAVQQASLKKSKNINNKEV